ncbi:hypothetical protein F2Q65_09525 [Thiohalocapsa marina]|uniref:DUF4426 domain-containing protein n=1 Tax=Thiohalocapsa marina TaxID=424902 RepID=A0A5M8FKA3_9GAMM|nr:hypothetical protein [Thiohalocapsa marina]KAA6185328.1 hypothetical protein F2Q65_09525 [Thiohalocapsa marina]
MVATLLLALGLGPAITGCASGPTATPDAGLHIERISSSGFTITQTQVRSEDGTVSVRGEVARRIPQRGPIPGAVHISVLGPDGALLAETDAMPMRRNRQATAAHFYARLMLEPPAGGSIRIEHRLSGLPSFG